jgi:hypothetical protein
VEDDQLPSSKRKKTQMDATLERMEAITVKVTEIQSTAQAAQALKVAELQSRTQLEQTKIIADMMKSVLQALKPA